MSPWHDARVERERLTRQAAPNEEELSAIADRLQQLSVGEVERVLERAIELQTEAHGGAQRELLDTDTLGRIASRFPCVNVRELAAVNNIRPPRYLIRTGQRLRIPACR